MQTPAEIERMLGGERHQRHELVVLIGDARAALALDRELFARRG